MSVGLVFFICCSRGEDVQESHYDQFGIDYTCPELYVTPGEQSNLKDEYVKQVRVEAGITGNAADWENLVRIYNWVLDHMTFYSGGGALIGKVTANQVFETRVVSGCHDAALIISSLLREFGFPTLIIDTASIQWAYDFHNGLTAAFIGHTLTEAYVNNRWLLLDMNGKYVSNYDPYNPYIPSPNPGQAPWPLGLHVLKKGIDIWSYGVRSPEDLHQIMTAFASEVEAKCSDLKDPKYNWQSL